MAKRRTKTSRKSKYTALEKQAYNMGLIERGLKNSNSLVYESYHNGLEKKQARVKKPLIGD